MSLPATGPRHDAGLDRAILVGACVIVALAFLLRVRPDERVAVHGLARWPVPPTCPTRTWLGVACPTCGLTRSLIHLAHADWRRSVQYHRLGWLVAAAIVLQIPYRALRLRRAGRPRIGPAASWLLASLLYALVVGNWLLDRLR